MRQDDQVDGLGGERQLVDIVDEGYSDGIAVGFAEMAGFLHPADFGFRHEGVGVPAVGHPVFFQCIDFGKTDLHGIESENVCGKGLEMIFFPSEDVLADRSHQPVVHGLDFLPGAGFLHVGSFGRHVPQGGLFAMTGFPDS